MLLLILTAQFSVEAESTLRSQRFDYYLFAGIREIKNTNYDKAVTLFNFCQQTDSNCALVNFHLGNIYRQQKKDDKALAYYRRAFLLEPSDYWNNYISVLWSEDSTRKQAVSELENAYRTCGSTEMMSALVMMYKQQGQYKKALTLLDQYEQKKGVSEGIIHEKCDIYLMQNKPKKAIAIIDKYIEKNNNDYLLPSMKGDIYYAMGKKEKASETYKQERNRHPDNPYILLSLANYYMSEGNRDEAAGYIFALLRTDVDADYKIEVASSPQIERVFPTDSARAELFNTIIDLHPDETRAYEKLSECLMREGKYAEATHAQEAIMQLAPNYLENAVNLYYSYAQTGDTTHLFAHTDTCLNRFPKILLWKYLKMMQLSVRHKYQQVIEMGREAKNLDPATDKYSLNVVQPLYAILGYAYFQTDSIEQGIDCYETALAIDSEDIETLNNYAYMLALENRDLSKAERMSRQTIEKQPDNPVFLDTYAWILYLRGDKILAKYYIQKAMKLEPNTKDPEMIEHYNIILSE